MVIVASVIAVEKSKVFMCLFCVAAWWCIHGRFFLSWWCCGCDIFKLVKCYFDLLGALIMSKYRYRITNENKAKLVARLRKENVAYWQLAQVLECHENTVAKLMRDPSDEIVERINAAIDEVAATVE